MEKSYTSRGQSTLDQLRQIFKLRRFYSSHTEKRVDVGMSEIRRAEKSVQESYGIELRGLKILEIGPGQFMGQLPYLALNNQVIGVDSDIVAQGFDVPQYIKMVMRNGAARMAKTVGRKALGIDRRYRAKLREELAVTKLPAVEIRLADVMNLPFEEGSFDFVYSRAVFQCIPEPVRAIRQIKRVLKPGGISYISLQPYTCPTGCLDPRVLYGGIENELGLWPHLRAELKEQVRPNSYLNRFGLRDWKELFNAECEMPHYVLTKVGDEYFALARELKEAGHLKEYSMEELTTGALDVMFRKID